MGKSDQKLLITICEPGETAEEAERRAEQENPNFGCHPGDLHVVVKNFGIRKV